MTDYVDVRVGATPNGGIEFRVTDEDGDTRKWGLEQSDNRLVIVVETPDGERNQLIANEVNGNILVDE